MAAPRTVAACLLAAAALTAVFAPAAADDGWVQGRGTFFGEDAWSLHQGSCGYGFICPNRWSDELVSGRDVVALATPKDTPMWNGGAACGTCLQVRCRDATFTDATGASFDRSGSQYCKAGHPVVKVKITDQCQCHYGPNAVSNARWCCGDMPHLDVSQWALEKMALDVEKWGVFALEWQTVDCKAAIENEAPAVPLSEQDPDPHADMQGSVNCADQSTGSAGSSGSASGGLTTQSSSSQRATITKSYKPSKYDWRARLKEYRAAKAAGKPLPNIVWKSRKLMAASA